MNIHGFKKHIKEEQKKRNRVWLIRIWQQCIRTIRSKKKVKK